MTRRNAVRRPLLAAAVLALSACAAIRPGRVVDETDFTALQPGMTRDQVIARVGPPTWSFQVRQEHLTIMNYRYSHSSCVLYQVSVRPDGTVRDVGTASDPACDSPN